MNRSSSRATASPVRRTIALLVMGVAALGLLLIPTGSNAVLVGFVDYYSGMFCSNATLETTAPFVQANICDSDDAASYLFNCSTAKASFHVETTCATNQIIEENNFACQDGRPAQPGTTVRENAVAYSCKEMPAASLVRREQGTGCGSNNTVIDLFSSNLFQIGECANSPNFLGTFVDNIFFKTTVSNGTVTHQVFTQRNCLGQAISITALAGECTTVSFQGNNLAFKFELLGASSSMGFPLAAGLLLVMATVLISE